MTEKVLCVDDEANILEAYRRGLRKQFHIDTALGAEEALAQIDAQGPYAVVVSDMRMPGMDGIRLLSEVRQRAPDSVRIMLTGFADLKTAVEAVNEGNIFRFLTKPCPPEVLAKALTAGMEQYRLVRAEKELLEKTLRGAVKILTEVLSLTNPTAFGHASRVRRIVRKLCERMGVENSWQFEIAGMLSQIGCVTVPPTTLEKVYHGQTLKPDEVQMIEAHPAVGRDLVANIPRLENVAQIIAYQQKRFDGSGIPADSVAGKDIPLGARILKVALDYDTLKWSGETDRQVTIELLRHSGWYDPEVLEALETVTGFETVLEVQDVRLEDLATHMIIAEDVTTVDGALLVNKGQDVTLSLCQRLRNFARGRGIKEPIRVLRQPRLRARTGQHGQHDQQVQHSGAQP
ncbi:MAG: response regulator [Phycisphaerae bacterium]|nr:response regulator [Phycisphaerae bacterium]